MDSPRISVIMPVFNTGGFLAEAIDSVLHQQATASMPLPSFELIVIDDGSTDPQTLEILSDRSNDPRVTVLNNQRKKGASGARNTGIEHARGDWIGFLDSDDLWFPHSLSQRWKAIVANEGVRWIAGQFRFLRPNSSESSGQVFESAQTLFASLVENTVAPLSAIFDRSGSLARAA
jgi:glycosyltransferase involved in cell wall biosynthesis